MTMDTLLGCAGLSAGYGSMAVVRELDLHVARGEVVALLGANGAGKTTTLLTLAGQLPPLAGTVLADGKPTKAPMHERCRTGLSFITEERSVIMGLTAKENLKLAGVPTAAATALFPELEPVLNRPAGLLSGGEQQMLTLARALARRPRALLADELSLGLAPIIVRRLLTALRQAADTDGVGVLLVEQHVRQALRFADRVYVLNRGRLVLEGPVADVQSQLGAIEAAYLAGAAAEPDRPEPTAALATPVAVPNGPAADTEKEQQDDERPPGGEQGSRVRLRQRLRPQRSRRDREAAGG
ncbi:ATP-binding cassette domain-containing protein [Frankia sp. CNm7]|uniref:ATP-binding cassette domain-containing protein n=1 Tax=Frankia nepalensis TaxID=1836974 RepID=A0A937UUZ6_9ACTN|nr:ATP-binding cassette domain-containing protein [Frankia nepalensis]MBL7500996.1 ATP-binding cassette domain-containing protein [Frankia nepalensis]MBL7512458.1 ATP-binding cassette domain-containing protein [Frankia nepalensis]MBL7521523.1 ATP-binding cassette domain-containing protein [Frankia nepalensis]MBL7632760.1 ATP-binding cassette domain-containing protein [Frankia nepalensis]